MSEAERRLRECAYNLGINRDEVAGVAVSGGSDSLAMLYLLKEAGWKLEAVTVDHGLRDGSATEVGFVADECASLDVPHSALAWRRVASSGNLQDQARQARYSLIRNWAESKGIRYVALGHTMDDQAETVLMRIARGSGLDGLCGMDTRRVDGAVTWLRPFLTARRDELRAYLKARNISWVDDPSNEDQRFDRVRARLALEHLAPLGIDAIKLRNMSDHLKDVRLDLDIRGHDAFLTAGEEDRGDIVLRSSDFRKAAGGPEVLRRTLVKALRWVSGADYPPRGTSLTGLMAALPDVTTRTLLGCVVTSGEDVRVTREFNAVKDLLCPTDQLWDGRWKLDGPHAPELEIRALGKALSGIENWREAGLPRASLLASPAVWRGDELVAAPLAGLANGWTASATGRGTFAQFLQSR